VRTGIGVAAIVTGSGMALLVVVRMRRHLRGVLPTLLLAACGALVGAGALLVQEAPGVGDWAIAPAVLAVLTPVHARLVAGPAGGRG
jgi:peptidoglycan/LPS O-acetylase OafA/YrhL